MNENPYRAPAMGAYDDPAELPLAGLGLRFAGAMVDGGVKLLAMVPAMESAPAASVRLV